MRKNEFLSELRQRLKGLPKEDLDNRISFYEEMIDDRIDEGISEEDAVAEIGTVDEVVKQIAEETPLARLVKERTKPKRSLRAWEIVLLVLGFPLWFPLMLVGLVLCLVFYILVWILVIVTYVVEASLIVSSIGSLVVFFAYLGSGEISMLALGSSIICAGGALLFFFACVGATKVTLKLSKSILTKIKTSFLKKEKKQ